jgi:hypothetical protein
VTVTELHGGYAEAWGWSGQKYYFTYPSCSLTSNIVSECLFKGLLEQWEESHSINFMRDELQPTLIFYKERNLNVVSLRPSKNLPIYYVSSSHFNTRGRWGMGGR